MNQSRIIEQIKYFVKKECEKPNVSYGKEFYDFHIVPMADLAKKLAKELQADVEVVEITAWLHDIGSVIYGRKDHHITGLKITRKKLEDLGYPNSKINRVEKCVHNHRGSVNNKRESLEEKIISDADAMVNFDTVPGLFKAAYVYEDLDQGEARILVRKKLERKYKQLYFKESKDMVRDKYKAMKEILD